MKTPFKIIAATCMITAMFFAQGAKAQTTPANAWRLGFGLDASEPTGTAKIGSNFSLGANIRLQYGLSNSFALTLTGGADHFFMKTNPATGQPYDSFGIIPLRVGFKEFFIPNIYIAGEVGTGIEAVDSQDGPWHARLDLSPAIGYASTHW